MERADFIDFLQTIYNQTQQRATVRSPDDDKSARVCGCFGSTQTCTFPPSDSHPGHIEASVKRLNRTYVVKMKNAAIKMALEAAVWPAKDVYIDYGNRIPIFDDVSRVGDSESVAFIRADCALMVWDDSADSLVSTCKSIQACLEEVYFSDRDANVATHSTIPSVASDLAGMEVDDLLRADVFLEDPTGFDSPLSQMQNRALPSLPGLSFLSDLPPPPSPPSILASPQIASPHIASPHIACSPDMLHSEWRTPRESDFGSDHAMTGLQKSFRNLYNTHSPAWSDASTFPSSNGSTVSPSDLNLTICLADISPPPNTLGDLLPGDEDEDADEKWPEDPEAPASPSTPYDSDREAPISQASPSKRVVGQKSKRPVRDDDDGDDDADDDEYVPSPATRASAGQRKRTRVRSVSALDIGIAVPFPPTNTPIFHATFDEDSDDAASAPGSPAPTESAFPERPVAGPSHAPAAAARPRRRKRKAGRATKAQPRARCDFCPRSFTRPKDRDRHMYYSCEQNPDKKGALCEECGELLSRPDSATRHLKVHEKKGLPPPILL